jgi:hypothetical protein
MPVTNLVKNVGAVVAGVLLAGLVVQFCIPQAGAALEREPTIRIVKVADGSTCYVIMGPKGNPRAMSCK